jgi:hypothetical protein
MIPLATEMATTKASYYFSQFLTILAIKRETWDIKLTVCVSQNVLTNSDQR